MHSRFQPPTTADWPVVLLRNALSGTSHVMTRVASLYSLVRLRSPPLFPWLQNPEPPGSTTHTENSATTKLKSSLNNNYHAMRDFF